MMATATTLIMTANLLVKKMPAIFQPPLAAQNTPLL